MHLPFLLDPLTVHLRLHLISTVSTSPISPPCVVAPQADLADRDFTAERGTAVVVVSTGVVDPLAEARREEERAVAEARHAHRLALPRRPAWSADTTAEQLDHQVGCGLQRGRAGMCGLAALGGREGERHGAWTRRRSSWTSRWSDCRAQRNSNET